VNQSQHENTPPVNRPGRKRSKLRIFVVSMGLISLGAVLGAVLTTSSVVYATLGGYKGHDTMTLEEIQDRAGGQIDWMLGGLDAGDEQSRQLKAMGLELISDLYPIKQQHHAYKREFISQLRSGEPDAGILEDLRRKELELADIASARILAALLKGNDILTPEQRDNLARHFRHGPR